MSLKWDYLRRAQKVFARKQHLPWPVLVRKALTASVAMASAPAYLHQATSVGARVRTIGRPRIENDGELHIGDDVILRSVNVPLELCVEPGARLDIGAGCSFNYGVSIGATASIYIGKRVRLGPYVMIVDSDFHQIYQRDQRPPSRPVVIEDDVWIGAKASILPGVHIGRGAIVGTGAVVTRDVEAFSIVAGVPARVLKKLDEHQFQQGGTHA